MAMPPPMVNRKPPSSSAPGPSKAKTFSVVQNATKNVGKKLVIYGASGAGKTSLASMAPDPVFIDLDNGTTGLQIRLIPGITDFDDLREAVKQSIRFIPEKGTLVIDTVSKVDEYLTEHLKSTLNLTSIKKLGYDRFPSSVEAFRLLVAEFDPLIRSGRNVVLCAHEATINFKNALGDDFRQMGPKLTHSANDSCRDELCAWADHVFRIGYEEVAVANVVESGPQKNRIGKVANASSVRYIYTSGTASMIAKSRVLAGKHLPPLIAFAGPSDYSLWTMLMNPETIPNE